MCFCFPSSTTVVTKQGVKRLDEIRPGDFILTLNKHQQQKWTKFYTWGHREKDLSADFLKITVVGGSEICISENHLLFVVDKENEHAKVAKMAGQLVIGDKLYHISSTRSVTMRSIVSIIPVQLSGAYAPFTMSGTFLGNNFLVACYASVNNFKLAHAVLAPLRFWTKSTVKKDAERPEGIHGYNLALMKMRESLPTSWQTMV